MIYFILLLPFFDIVLFLIYWNYNSIQIDSHLFKTSMHFQFFYLATFKENLSICKVLVKCILLMVTDGERSSSAAGCPPTEFLGSGWAGPQLQRPRLSFSSIPQRTLQRGGFGSVTSMSKISRSSLLRKVGWAKCRTGSERKAPAFSRWGGSNPKATDEPFFLYFFKSYIDLCQHHKTCIFPLLVQVIHNR